MRIRLSLAAAVLCAAALPAAAQDQYILYPPDVLETLLEKRPFKLGPYEGSRGAGDRTTHALLEFTRDTAIEVKAAAAPTGGEAFNNVPRYELAAYELQKLFLDPHDYVVPTTALRMVPLETYRRFAPHAQPTFEDGASVLVVLQYWAAGLTSDGVYDRKRADRDTAYARHLGDVNVLTYLIRHRDANKGNVLLGEDPTQPRLFAVDNSISFESQPSNRGTDWEYLRVKRLPRGTVDRLRRIRPEDLQQSLAVLAEFELRDGGYVEAARGAPTIPSRGQRRGDGRVQLGLTDREIDGVRDRLADLLKRVDQGKVGTF